MIDLNRITVLKNAKELFWKGKSIKVIWSTLNMNGTVQIYLNKKIKIEVKITELSDEA